MRVGTQLWQWWRRRAAAVLVWPSPKPPYYGLNLAIGVMLGFAVVLIHPPMMLFLVFLSYAISGPLLTLFWLRRRRGKRTPG